MTPAYGVDALSDLLPSVLTSLGVPGERAPIALDPVTRTVLLLVDGLGLELLRAHADAAPFLSGLTTTPLSTGFPSTTATSLASLGTGLPPGEHGLTGYTSWVPEVGGVVGWLSWTHGRTDLRERLVPEQVQPRATALERAQAAGVEVTVAAPASFEGTGLTRAVLRGGRYRGSYAPGDAVAHAVEGSRRGDRSLVYCYTPDLDLLGHVRGTDSGAWLAQLALVDGFARTLAERLPAGTRLLVTADHGMVDVAEQDKVDLDERPDLLAGVRAVAGEPRARHVHTEPGAEADVLAAWTAALGDRMQVLSRAEVLIRGLLGPVVTPQAAERVGDVVAIATGPVAVVRRQAEGRMAGLRGQHGALTDAERLVPLLTT